MLALKVLAVAVTGVLIAAFGIGVFVLGLIGAVIARENKEMDRA